MKQFFLAFVIGVALSAAAWAEPDVYVAGGEFVAAELSAACYWKNGVKTALTDSKLKSDATAIAVSGSTVYVAGDTEFFPTKPCYWKNGARVALPDSAPFNVYGIAVSGNDVYVLGEEKNAANIDVACYYRNGVKTTLTNGRAIGTARDIVLIGR